jgi:hypothetical protein
VLADADLQAPAHPQGAQDPEANPAALGLQRGEDAEILSLAEIRATLDPQGALDGLPFMPEMERHAGKRVQVYRRADRLCVEGAPTLRRLRDTVFLGDLRCDGSAHGGCQRSCLMLWKEAWLRRSSSERAAPAPASVGVDSPASSPPAGNVREGSHYSCQSTALFAASTPMPAWRPDQYVRDLATGNLTPLELAHAFFSTAKHRVDMRVTRTVRRARPKKTPREQLGLQPGEWVQIKSVEEINATLDPAQKNRGLEFSPGMSAYCGGRYRVGQRIERMIDEGTGLMRGLTDTVMLEKSYCDGLCTRGCPRATPLYWREIWLRRVPAP